VISWRVGRKPKGFLLAFAYAIAVPIWILSAPLMAIGGLGAWTARRRQIFPNDTSEV
jgi:hypothetical protein